MNAEPRFRRMRVLLVLAFSALFAGTFAAAESPYFPLSEGWSWTYTGDGNDIASAWIEGVQQVQGIETTILHWQFTGVMNDYVEQYYTVDIEGNVFIHGGHAVDVGLIASYDPPILYLPSSLALNTEWCSTFQMYEDLEGTIPVGDSLEICFKVYSVDQLTVPAGTFMAYGVGQFLPGTLMNPSVERDVFGRRNDWIGRNASDWFAEDVGAVYFNIYQSFELVSWTEPPTPERSTTWGEIKALFLPHQRTSPADDTRE